MRAGPLPYMTVKMHQAEPPRGELGLVSARVLLLRTLLRTLLLVLAGGSRELLPALLPPGLVGATTPLAVPCHRYLPT